MARYVHPAWVDDTERDEYGNAILTWAQDQVQGWQTVIEAYFD